MIPGVKAQVPSLVKKRNTRYCPIYKEIPTYELGIEEIVSFAYHRRRFHESISSLELSENPEKTFIRYFIPYSMILNKVDRTNRILPDNFSSDFSQREFDEIGFYSLMIVSLRSNDAQHDFIERETQIFMYRLRAHNNLTLDDIDPELFDDNLNLQQYFDPETNQFNIPFQIIFPYIDVSMANLKNGYVHLNMYDFTSFLGSLYKIYLTKKMAGFRKLKVHQNNLFDAIVQLYEEKETVFSSKQRTNFLTLSLDDVDTVASRSFPPCMFRMYQKLRQNHKLFHSGRIQFGLFLKGIGLSLNDSLKFWGNEFSKLVGIDGFEKQYAYGIRYLYGKEGSNKDYTPYSCMGILMRAPAPSGDQTHGCPFKTLSQDINKSLIYSMINSSKKYRGVNVSKDDVITALVEKGKKHPQISCTDLFNLIHDKDFEDNVVQSPCSYYFESEDQYKPEE